MKGTITMKTIYAVLLFIICPLAMAQQNESKQNQLAVVGSVELKEVADQVSLSFSIKGTGSTLRNAVGNADAQTQALNQTLIKIGVMPRDISTSGFYSGINYGDQSLFSSKRDYKASITTVVKIDSIPLLEPVLFAICEAGIEHLSQLTFSLKDELSVKRRARIEAAVKAKEKADDMAKALGITLGKIINVEEVQQTKSQPVQPMNVYPNPFNPVLYRSSASNLVSENIGFGESSGEGFNAQTISVTSQVSVVYEIK
jgi:uncharacterized protein YggE